MSLCRALVDSIVFQNIIFMVMCIYVRGPTLARLAMVLVLLSIGNTPALRIIRAGTRLTVHRSLPILPMENNTKTIAKRARVEPRTQVHVTMEKLFRIWISSISVRGSDMIVLDIVLKLWIEPITLSIHHATEKFYRVRVVSKSPKFGWNLENFEKSQYFKNVVEGGACSTSYPSGNQVDGSPLVALLVRR